MLEGTVGHPDLVVDYSVEGMAFLSIMSLNGMTSVFNGPDGAWIAIDNSDLRAINPWAQAYARTPISRRGPMELIVGVFSNMWWRKGGIMVLTGTPETATISIAPRQSRRGESEARECDLSHATGSVLKSSS